MTEKTEMVSAYDQEAEEPIDDGEGSMSTEGEAELLHHWAAGAIQRQWRDFYTRSKAENPVHAVRERCGGEVCCACFAPIDESGGDALAPEYPDVASETRLFCGSCQAKLRRGLPVGSVSGGVSNPVSHSVASPLPKLSLLVQTEAKYQEQLRLLRQQQDLLRQQQHELEQRKKLQADTLALEKQLAKQRRREFKQLMARRQAEEARRLLEIASPPADKSTSKPRAKPLAPPRPRTVTAADASTLLEPTQLRRHRIPAPPPRSVDTDAAASKAAELAERAAQEHRRRQKLETLKCYAQDLTPLVHGNKPKKLPFPTSATTTQNHHNYRATRTQLKKTPPTTGARKPSKIVQLTPLNQTPGNNQQEQTPMSPELRVAIPRQSYETYAMGSVGSKAAPTPLTAEIKPAAWMYELLTSDPVLSSVACDTSASVRLHEAFALTGSHSRTQLSTLHEEQDDGVMELQTASAGQRVTLAPLAPVTSCSATIVAGPAPNEAAPLATYSSERLASLLQKYNVTVARPPALG